MVISLSSKVLVIVTSSLSTDAFANLLEIYSLSLPRLALIRISFNSFSFGVFKYSCFTGEGYSPTFASVINLSFTFFKGDLATKRFSGISYFL